MYITKMYTKNKTRTKTHFNYFQDRWIPAKLSCRLFLVFKKFPLKCREIEIQISTLSKRIRLSSCCLAADLFFYFFSSFYANQSKHKNIKFFRYFSFFSSCCSFLINNFFFSFKIFTASGSLSSSRFWPFSFCLNAIFIFFSVLLYFMNRNLI